MSLKIEFVQMKGYMHIGNSEKVGISKLARGPHEGDLRDHRSN